MRVRFGFTLIEILIVVVILGILAAIVIPQFTEASYEAELSSLTTDLQTVRAQIELYRIQHKDNFPGTYAGVGFGDAMTKYTRKSGALATPQEPGTRVYGPYLQKMPTNPFNDLNTIDVDGTLGDDSHGWYYNMATGAFHADTDGHTGY